MVTGKCSYCNENPDKERNMLRKNIYNFVALKLFILCVFLSYLGNSLQICYCVVTVLYEAFFVGVFSNILIVIRAESLYFCKMTLKKSQDTLPLSFRKD